MNEYCKVVIKGVQGETLENYRVMAGITEDGEEIEPIYKKTKSIFHLKEGVYLCQYKEKNVEGKIECKEVNDKKKKHSGKERFCSIEKMFTVGKEDLGKNKVLEIPKIKIDNVEAEGKQPIYLFSDKLEECFYTNDDSLGKLEEYSGLGVFKDIAFDTPAYKPDKNENQFTTNNERWEFLKDFEGRDNYFLYDSKFPVVIFSRENLDGKDLFFDLEILKNSKKLNIFYQAQVHGNEYAAGEGALTVIEKLIENGKCLENLNIVIIPCVNQLGNSQSTRDCGKININRDFLECQAEETCYLHDVFFGFLPEVVIDAHTFTRKNSFIGDSLKKAMYDLRISGATTKNIDKDIKEINDQIVEYVIKNINRKNNADNVDNIDNTNNVEDSDKQALRAGYYGNSINCNLGRLYYNLLGGCSILLETEGTRSGKFHFKRNVSCQVKGVLSILSFACREKENIKNQVLRNRRRFLDGSNIHRKYVFNHRCSGVNNRVVQVWEYDPFGRVLDKEATIEFKCYDEPVKVVEIPKQLIFDRERFEGGLEGQLAELFVKNHVVFEKKDDIVVIDMNQITQFVIIELLRDTDMEL